MAFVLNWLFFCASRKGHGSLSENSDLQDQGIADRDYPLTLK